MRLRHHLLKEALGIRFERVSHGAEIVTHPLRHLLPSQSLLPRIAHVGSMCLGEHGFLRRDHAQPALVRSKAGLFRATAPVFGQVGELLPFLRQARPDGACLIGEGLPGLRAAFFGFAPTLLRCRSHESYPSAPHKFRINTLQVNRKIVGMFVAVSRGPETPRVSEPMPGSVLSAGV